MTRTLADVLPACFVNGDYDRTMAFQFKDMFITKEHSQFYDQDEYTPWPGNHKHVYLWVELENGLAVGWNENPEKGWSFPIIKIPQYNI